MTKVSDIGSRKPLCRFCGNAPASEHPGYTCPKLAGATEYPDGTVEYNFVQTFAVEVTHRVQSDEDPPE